jgi:hypothetical protein
VATTTTETVAERIEAEARAVMARLHAPRGWQDRREQTDDRVFLDALLDQANDLRRKG